jgi:ABC-2 type transport system ATP-binding protein
MLSTGYCTIAKVILTLASKVPLMLFDEPVLGIDSIYRKMFYTELQELHGRLGNTVVITTHILDELDGVVDHLIILKKGKVILDDKYGNIVKDGTTLADEYIRLHGVGTDD